MYLRSGPLRLPPMRFHTLSSWLCPTPQARSGSIGDPLSPPSTHGPGELHSGAGERRHGQPGQAFPERRRLSVTATAVSPAAKILGTVRRADLVVARFFACCKR